MMTTTLEREIKLPYPSPEEAREAVLATGATPVHGRRLQEDALLDTDDEELRRRRCILRVRTEDMRAYESFHKEVLSRLPGVARRWCPQLLDLARWTAAASRAANRRASCPTSSGAVRALPAPLQGSR